MALNTKWLFQSPLLWQLRTPGNTCLSALKSKVADPDSKGAGGVMRVAPCAFFADFDFESFDFGMAAAKVTHAHPTGFLAAGAFSMILKGIIHGKLTLKKSILQTLRRVLEEPEHEETVHAMILALEYHESSIDPTPENINALGAGWVAEEALAIALFCALSFENDFRSGVLAAVNITGDRDTTGSMTGTLLGAINGIEAIPQPWQTNLREREVLDDIEKQLNDFFDDGIKQILWENDVETMRQKITDGMDCNRCTFDGTPLLHGARSKEMAELLLTHGADPNGVNQNNENALFDCEQIETAVALIAGGCDIHHDCGGKTALFCTRSPEIAELLISHGASLRAIGNTLWTPLHCVSNVEVASVIIRHGADVHARDWNGCTPLHFAKSQELIDFLIHCGADPESKNHDGITALDDARKGIEAWEKQLESFRIPRCKLPAMED